MPGAASACRARCAASCWSNGAAKGDLCDSAAATDSAGLRQPSADASTSSLPIFASTGSAARCRPAHKKTAFRDNGQNISPSRTSRRAQAPQRCRQHQQLASTGRLRSATSTAAPRKSFHVIFGPFGNLLSGFSFSCSVSAPIVRRFRSATSTAASGGRDERRKCFITSSLPF